MSSRRADTKYSAAICQTSSCGASCGARVFLWHFELELLTAATGSASSSSSSASSSSAAVVGSRASGTPNDLCGPTSLWRTSSSTSCRYFLSSFSASVSFSFEPKNCSALSRAQLASSPAREAHAQTHTHTCACEPLVLL